MNALVRWWRQFRLWFGDQEVVVVSDANIVRDGLMIGLGGEIRAKALAALDALVAERDEARAALGQIAQPMPETDGDWGSTYDWEKSSKARRDLARAALEGETT